MLNSLISSVVQLGIVILLCLICYWAFGRKKGFGEFVGLKRAPLSILLAAAAIGAASAALLTALPPLRAVAAGPGSVVAAEAAHGLSAAGVATLLIVAIFKTAAAEELLFRGLIGKRLISWLGFPIGNTLQALLFGAVHLLLLAVAKPNLTAMAGLVCFAALLGALSGWLNERRANGSILPGFAAHAAANTISYLVLAIAYAR
jgi:membrane protease YdiL (CAAX protease family)